MTGVDAFWDGAFWIVLFAAIALLALLVYAWHEPRRQIRVRVIDQPWIVDRFLIRIWNLRQGVRAWLARRRNDRDIDELVRRDQERRARLELALRQSTTDGCGVGAHRSDLRKEGDALDSASTTRARGGASD